MFNFRSKNGKISVYRDNLPVISNISFWLKPDYTEKIFLDFISLENGVAYFNSKLGNAKLYIEQEDNCFSLKASVEYTPQLSKQKLNNHLDIKEAFGINFDSLDINGNYMASFANAGKFAENESCEFCARPFISDDICKMPQRTQALLYKNSTNDYTFILSVCDKEFKSLFIGRENQGAGIMTYSNDYRNSGRMTLAIFTFGNDPYILSETATKYGMKILNKNYPLKKDRKYPEMLEYLGWCSWDAFHMDVSHDDLLAKAKEFKDKEIPVRWFMIDDMWGDVKLINRETMQTRELYSFKADEKRFPTGLEGIVNELKNDYKLCVGLWHPYTGYWHGFDPQGEIAKKYKDSLFFAPNGQLAIKPEYRHSSKIFMEQHEYYKNCGVDFVKIDNQGNIRNYSGLISSIGEAAHDIHNALEDSVDKYFDGGLINCMGMPIENYWNRPRSNVSRVSGDFQPENRKWFINHLLQCSYNCFVYGSLNTGDWDMWWSDDEQAEKNAVLRAMSGGPVYVSDELERSIKNKIMPIVLSDGRILRLKNSALPTEDCLLENSATNKKVYKVFNKIENYGVLAVFNLDENEDKVSGKVRIKDIPELDNKEYCVYDWFAKTAVKLKGDDELPLELKNYNDFRLLIFAPIENGIAPIGLIDKYMAPATFKKVNGELISLENGNFIVYSEKEFSGNKVNENLYTVKAETNKVVHL